MLFVIEKSLVFAGDADQVFVKIVGMFLGSVRLVTGPEGHLPAAGAPVEIAGDVLIVARLERDAIVFIPHELRKISHNSLFAKPRHNVVL